MTLLFIVADTFEIRGRGLVLVAEAPCLAVELHRGDRIQLRTPVGRVLGTHIAAIEILCGPKVHNHTAILLPASIAKLDVPNGTEVRLIRRSPKPSPHAAETPAREFRRRAPQACTHLRADAMSYTRAAPFWKFA
jgi:hypothetical protein